MSTKLRQREPLREVELGAVEGVSHLSVRSDAPQHSPRTPSPPLCYTVGWLLPFLVVYGVVIGASFHEVTDDTLLIRPARLGRSANFEKATLMVLPLFLCLIFCCALLHLSLIHI